MATNNRPLKAYVRYDGSGRAVSSSLIWRKNKPKVGNWKEVQGYECCGEDCTLVPIPTTCQGFDTFPFEYGTAFYFTVSGFSCNVDYTITQNLLFQIIISTPVANIQELVNLINSDPGFKEDGISAVIDGECISVSVSKCKCLYKNFDSNIAIRVAPNEPA
jgi:hypothetical protein